MVKLKPDKEQRHSFYVILKEEAKDVIKTRNYDLGGLCNLSRRVIDVYPNEEKSSCYLSNDALFSSFYPELLSLKPDINEDNVYWFTRDKKGWEQRIKLLDEAIKMTE
jgi:hypothetical protein